MSDASIGLGLVGGLTVGILALALWKGSENKEFNVKETIDFPYGKLRYMVRDF